MSDTLVIIYYWALYESSFNCKCHIVCKSQSESSDMPVRTVCGPETTRRGANIEWWDIRLNWGQENEGGKPGQLG